MTFSMQSTGMPAGNFNFLTYSNDSTCRMRIKKEGRQVTQRPWAAVSSWALMAEVQRVISKDSIITLVLFRPSFFLVIF